MLSLEPGSVTSDMARQRGHTGQLRPDVSAAERERERERERSKSIEVGGSRIRKLEKTLGPLFTKKEYIDKSVSKFPIKFQLNMEE